MKTRIAILTTLLGAGVVVLVVTWPREGRRGGQPGSPGDEPAPLRWAEVPIGRAGGPAREETGSPGLEAGWIDRVLGDGMRVQEAVLTFKDRAALDAFLARADAAGLRVLASIGALNAARVRFSSLADLRNDWLEHADDYAELDGNVIMTLPLPPGPADRAAMQLVPVGNQLLSFLGVTTDTSQWGRGVTLAVIDSGIAGDPTFGAGRVVTLDLGMGIEATAHLLGHGTAVAALAAGASPDAQGVAPAALLLSVPVIGGDGTSDVFTVAQAIVTAVDAGAQIINLSLGTYQNSGTMQRALDYALARNVVVVAAAGNDQAAQLTWPAADPRVVSVGAVDALQQQVTFSNSGPQLQITAPGYGVQTAWTDGTRVWLDGTSASAPIVAGAIAAMMSQNPGMTAGQAWSVLREHVAEAGPAGPDADFGQGVIDLGWAMARDDFARIDTAVASHHYDAASGAMQFVVQNRSATTMAGLRMVIEVDGARSEALLEPVPPGGTTTVTVPVTADQLQGPAPVSFTTRLVNPPGVVDAVPANNLRSSSVGGRLPAGGEAGGSDG